MAQQVVETAQLTKHFGEVTALAEVDLAVPAGALFGLLGPDGAGKTTLMRILATVLEKSSGSATAFGHSVSDKKRWITPRIGYMSQHFSLYPDLSVWENLDLFATLRGVAKKTIKTRGLDLLESMGLAMFTARRAGLLSGGMKQKLMLATVLIHEPDLLLLDEPTTGVDPVSRREFWNLLSALHAQRKTILVATPYMDEAERCSQLAFLNRGVITAAGSPTEIKEKVPGVVLEVIAPKLRSAQRIIDDLPDVITSQLTGETLRVLSLHSETYLLADALLDAGLEFESIAPVELDMETAFIYLTGRPV